MCWWPMPLVTWTSRHSPGQGVPVGLLLASSMVWASRRLAPTAKLDMVVGHGAISCRGDPCSDRLGSTDRLGRSQESLLRPRRCSRGYRPGFCCSRIRTTARRPRCPRRAETRWVENLCYQADLLKSCEGKAHVMGRFVGSCCRPAVEVPQDVRLSD